MRQTRIDFYTSKRLSLEGVFTLPDGLKTLPAGVVVCHPHPLLGGDMEHPLIVAICRAAQHEGIASLRFNFRGVGDSEGEFSGGDKEQDDLRAALDVFQQLDGVDRARIAIAGYSFGASVVLGGLQRYKAARGMVMIAPPLSGLRKSKIARDKRPKLFVAGQRDKIAPSADLQSALDDVRPPVQFEEVPDADHLLAGNEEAVTTRVVEFLLATLGGEGREPTKHRQWREFGSWPLTPPKF